MAKAGGGNVDGQGKDKTAAPGSHQKSSPREVSKSAELVKFTRR